MVLHREVEPNMTTTETAAAAAGESTAVKPFSTNEALTNTQQAFIRAECEINISSHQV